MDPIKNPYSPGAGAPPPELVGRGPILKQAEILLGRMRARRPEKSLLLTGLRGVGTDIERNLLNINSEQFMQTIHIFFGPTAESKREFAFEEE
ncbi:MAG: hypothetical protein S4CHLAM123_00290 [Chlamydiales bacterium]|nr:hypothetical protein [Chlamydiales bacterium]